MKKLFKWVRYVVYPTDKERLLADRWQDRTFREHVNVGRITVYGANAMHWTIQWASPRWGYLCFHPTTRTFGGYWPWYFYASPNGTPWGATYAIGPGVTGEEKQAAKWRAEKWGHGYSTYRWNPLFPLHPDEPMDAREEPETP